MMISRVSVSFESAGARLFGRIAGIAGIVCSLLLFTALVAVVVRGVNSSILNRELGGLLNNWLVTLFKLHFGVDGITNGMLRGVALTDVVILLLTTAVGVGLWFVLKSTTMAWSIVGMVLPVLGLILFIATQLAGRSAVMAAVLFFALITLWSSGFDRIAPFIGIIAAVLLLVGDFTEPLHSKVIALLVIVGYALLDCLVHAHWHQACSSEIVPRHKLAQRHITARMCIGAPSGRLGLRGAAARRSATWPLALVGLGATSHTCGTLCAIVPFVNAV